jgi:hypothetical protein
VIRLDPRQINTGHLGIVLRVTQPTAFETPATVVGPLVAIEHRLMHPKIGTIRTHIQIGSHSIDTSAPHTVIEMYSEEDQ